MYVTRKICTHMYMWTKKERVGTSSTASLPSLSSPWSARPGQRMWHVSTANCSTPPCTAERLVFCCRTTSASTAPCTSRKMCCQSISAALRMFLLSSTASCPTPPCTAGNHST